MCLSDALLRYSEVVGAVRAANTGTLVAGVGDWLEDVGLVHEIAVAVRAPEALDRDLVAGTLCALVFLREAGSNLNLVLLIGV